MSIAATLPIPLPRAAPAPLRAHRDFAPRAVLARLALGTLFFWSYVASYVALLPDIYENWGLGQNIAALSPITFGLWLLAIVPAVFLRPTLRHTSDFFIYIQYFLIYVPSLWVAYNSSRPVLTTADSTLIVVTLFLSMMLLVLLQRIRRARPHVELQAAPGRVRALIVVSVLMFLVIGSALKWHLNLVGFDAIYELRNDAGDTLAEGGSFGVGYLFPWLNGALLPVLVCIGVYRKDKVLVLGSTLIYVLLYGLWGSKASLLAAPAIIVVNWLCRRFEGRHLAAFTLFFSFLLLLPLTFAFSGSETAEMVTPWYAYVVHQRTFSSSALLIPQYLEFFSKNPHTYGSHISGLSMVLHYPFKMEVARMVGQFQYGTAITANANYWAQDGIAAFGLAGVPLASVVAALLFKAVDYRLRRLPVAFCVACMTFMASNLIDTSIFTTLISGGMLLIIVILPLLFKSRRKPAAIAPAAAAAPGA